MAETESRLGAGSNPGLREKLVLFIRRFPQRGREFDALRKRVEEEGVENPKTGKVELVVIRDREEAAIFRGEDGLLRQRIQYQGDPDPLVVIVTKRDINLIRQESLRTSQK